MTRYFIFLIALFCLSNALGKEESATYHPERLFKYKGRIMAIPEFHAHRAPDGFAKTNTLLTLAEWLSDTDVKVSEAQVIAHYNMNPNTVKRYMELSLRLTAEMCFQTSELPEAKVKTQDNEVDALRHFFMAFFLARHYSETQARHLLLAHEAWPQVDRELEIRNLMDIYNNEIGFEAAKEYQLPSAIQRRRSRVAKQNLYNESVVALAKKYLSSGQLFVWVSGDVYDPESDSMIDRSSLCTRTNVYPNIVEILNSRVIQPIRFSDYKIPARQ